MLRIASIHLNLYSKVFFVRIFLFVGKVGLSVVKFTAVKDLVWM